MRPSMGDGAPRREWRNFAGVFDRLGPPLRPSPSDVYQVRHAIAGHDDRVLLLGVTPELAVLGQGLVAIDSSPRMIAGVWPGDREGRRAMIGDWTELPFADVAFDAVVGDGSLNSAPAAVDAILRETARVLAPGGRAVFRTFCSPEAPETLAVIEQDVVAGWPGNFHALKWRIAMALAAATPDEIVPVRAILAAFDELFPDRAALAEQTGWSMDAIATIDAYADADHNLGFPTLANLLDRAEPFFADARVMPGAGYPLAERCPTIVWPPRERWLEAAPSAGEQTMVAGPH